jgi:trehalose 6-phosphate synthase
VISVNPFDVSQTTQAYLQAILMDKSERTRRLENLKDIVSKRTIYQWINEQFEDIEKIKTDEN